MRGGTKAPGHLRRVTRLLIGPSKLRRPSDRIEGTAVALLSAAFLVAVAYAAFLGWGFSQAEGAAAARLHPATAVLTRTTPAADSDMSGNDAAARWQAPDGKPLSGILTPVTAPGIWGASPGTKVPVWLSASGTPAPPPPGVTAVVMTAVVIGIATAGGIGVVLGVCYFLCRLLLDRRRLAGWESDWALTGPRWTMRR
jgi:hypothetical protein